MVYLQQIHLLRDFNPYYEGLISSAATKPKPKHFNPYYEGLMRKKKNNNILFNPYYEV